MTDNTPNPLGGLNLRRALVRIAVLLTALIAAPAIGLTETWTVAPQQIAQAALPKPEGRVILTISGAIKNTNDGDTAVFDKDMLLQFGTHELRTTTSWTDGVKVFEGVRASDVMDAVGAYGTTITATAINDYVVEIPVADFEKYGVLFAFTMDGVELTRRDRGPIWPVYPRDDFSELRNRAADKKWIWQLVSMEIR